MASEAEWATLWRENKQLQRRNEALAAVTEVGRKLSQTLDLYQLCRVIYREMVYRLWQVPHLSIALYEAEAELIHLAFLIADGEEMDVSGIPTMSLGEGPTSDTIRTREIQQVDLLAVTANLAPKGRAVHVGDERQPTVALFVPMVSEDRVVGVLGMQHYEADAFDDLDVDMLHTMAAQAGAALIHADLFRQIQRSERKYRELVETMPSGVVVSENGRFSFVNRAFCEMVGYAADELLGEQSLQMLIAPDDLTVLNSHNQRHLDTYVDDYELRLVHKDGRFIWNAIKIVPVRNGHGKITGSLSIHTDISARKNAEAALLETEHFLRSIMSSVQEGILVCDRELRVRYWNRHMEELTGLPMAEAMSRPIQQTCPFIAEIPLTDVLQTLSAGSSVPSFEKPFDYSPQGRKGWMNIGHSPLLNAEGDVQGMVVVMRDITERKATEEMMRQTQKLESLGVMAGGIAHDFNNLLVAMLVQTDLAEAKMARDNPSREHVLKSAQAAKRAALVTRQLLTYVGQDVPEMAPLKLNELVMQNVPLIKAAVPSFVSINVDLHPDLPEMMGNEGQMQQVLMNLVLNAAEAVGDAAGEVIVRTSLTQGTAVSERGWQHGITRLIPGTSIMLEVVDNGIGMSTETLKRIFDPFFTTKFTGRGLGLAAVLGIVRSHDGTIAVESEEKKGTIFRLLFPIVETEISKLPQGESMPEMTPLTQYTLLIIDDDESVCEAITDILSMEKMTVLKALNGRDGLDLYREHRESIDLVLLDYSMPGMSGGETLQALLAVDADVRVILSTGYAESRMQEYLNRGEVVGLLPKPFDLNSLVQTVNKHLLPR